jgi:alkylation response protein AidB-like acyl-CoA dehydrogenase
VSCAAWTTTRTLPSPPKRVQVHHSGVTPFGLVPSRTEIDRHRLSGMAHNRIVAHQSRLVSKTLWFFFMKLFWNNVAANDDVFIMSSPAENMVPLSDNASGRQTSEDAGSPPEPVPLKRQLRLFPPAPQLTVLTEQGPSGTAWLARIAEGWPSELRLGELTRLEGELASAVRRNVLKGEGLLSVKRDLARRCGYGGLDVPQSLGGSGRSSLFQAMAQFLAGYTDLDLRDAVHLAHGRFPVLHGSPASRERWTQPLVSDGELAAVLATEPTGGTALHRLSTTLRPRRPRKAWVMEGLKQYVSRVEEASVLTVFAQCPAGGLVAAVVPADRRGVVVEPLVPVGLGGWSWSRVRFEQVEVCSHELLPDADRAWQEHFTYYRPMVAACVLGAAAAYWDIVATFTRARLSSGAISRVRDTALEKLGEAEHAIRRAMLDIMHVTIAVEKRAPSAAIVSRSAKAAAVETARHVVDDLAGLLGAAGFQADSRAAKISRDIAAYRFADGHDGELMRSAGRAMLGGVA